MPANSILRVSIAFVAVIGACTPIAVSAGSSAEVVEHALPDDVAAEVVRGFDQIILILYLLESPDAIAQRILPEICAMVEAITPYVDDLTVLLEGAIESSLEALGSMSNGHFHAFLAKEIEEINRLHPISGDTASWIRLRLWRTWLTMQARPDNEPMTSVVDDRSSSVVNKAMETKSRLCDYSDQLWWALLDVGLGIMVIAVDATGAALAGPTVLPGIVFAAVSGAYGAYHLNAGLDALLE